MQRPPKGRGHREAAGEGTGNAPSADSASVPPIIAISPNPHSCVGRNPVGAARRRRRGAQRRLLMSPRPMSFPRKREPTPSVRALPVPLPSFPRRREPCIPTHRHSCVGRNPVGAARRHRRGATRPVSPDPQAPRHSRESGNLPQASAPYPPPCRHSRVGGNPASPRPMSSCVGRNPVGAARRHRRGASRPVSPDPQAPRHSRESGNLPQASAPYPPPCRHSRIGGNHVGAQAFSV